MKTIHRYKTAAIGMVVALLAACSTQGDENMPVSGINTPFLATNNIANSDSIAPVPSPNSPIIKGDLLSNLAQTYPGGALPVERASEAAALLAQNPAVLKYNAHSNINVSAASAKPQAASSYTVGLSAPVQRAQNTSLFGSYFFSIYAFEMNNALATNPTWNLEGTAFHASLGINPGLAPVWRFRNLLNGSYLYTIDEGEKADIIANYSAYFVLEGPAWYASPGPATGFTPLYRFRNLTNGTYLFSAYASEKAAIETNYAGIFLYEGISYYVRLTPPLELSLVAGSGSSGTVDGVGAAVKFGAPEGMAIDFRDGSMYVADRTLHVIRKIDGNGVVSTFAGVSGLAGTADGVGSAARFNRPWGVHAPYGSTGFILITDSGNHTIRMINTLTGAVTTPVGMPGVTGSTNGIGNAARFNSPRGITQSPDGSFLVVADTGNHTLRKINIWDAGVSTLAGSPGLAGTSNGVGAAARFNAPQGVTYDVLGQLYVVDKLNCAIRVVTPVGFVGAAAGLPGSCSATDGSATTARFVLPWSITANPLGGVYIADDYSVRKLSVDGVVKTVVGTNGADVFEEGLLPSKLGLFVNSLFVLPDNKLMISMQSGNRIVKVNGLP